MQEISFGIKLLYLMVLNFFAGGGLESVRRRRQEEERECGTEQVREKHQSEFFFLRARDDQLELTNLDCEMRFRAFLGICA